MVNSWDGLLDALEATPDIREWVLQRYIAQPLLLGGHKFHVRVYILCVGALRVYTFERILILLAAHTYNSADLNDIYCHLTNTTRNAELEDFSEEKYIKLLDDLPDILMTEHPDLAPSADKANDLVQRIREDIHAITNQLFSAYENEYTVFAPLSNCFELYGLDFLIDDQLKVHFLEANPGK